MKNGWLILVAMIAMLSCRNEKTTETKLTAEVENSQVQDISQIPELMRNQEEAWNNADIDGFMEHYWRSDSLRFLSKRGLTFGWNTVSTNYKKAYDSPDKMGRLQFDILHQKALGADHALVIGKWQVFRSSDTLGGHFSLIWEKVDGQWKIITDHTS